jgi:integrase
MTHKTPPRLPKYRHYKPKNLAVVRLNGRDVYLGRYNSPESREKYHQVLAGWLTPGNAPQPPAATADGAGPTVNEIILAFLTRHADTHYRRADGTPTGELDNFRMSLRPLRQLFGTTPARDLSPKALKAVRKAMIDAGLSRTTINQRVVRIVHVFKWAASEELVPPNVHQGLKAVPGLQKGRPAAREPEAVKPVPEADVDAVRPYVSAQVWAMIELQRLTGMRPGEVTIMRTLDLDMTGNLWVYTPPYHKTAHRGHERNVVLGPRAQVVLRPWLRTELTAFLFSPVEAMGEFRRQQRRKRKTPLTPSQRDRKPKRNPRRALGDHYSTRTYNHAVRSACIKAEVPHWHPNQIRHNVATRLRKEFGLEAASAVLGHADTDTTIIYAERDRRLAADAMERIG